MASRHRDRPAHVAIAGGSRGIGAALALALARPGVRLALAARDPGTLEDRATELRQRGAAVRLHPADLALPGAGADWLAGLADPLPPDLVIICLGLFGGRPAPGMAEPEALSRRLIEVNLAGAIALAEAAAAR
ncbi:SDR family NAD(P)-dependent oxidoreductase, partial [Oceanicola sp. S124]|uniref:SDR family NAD(P)-dependent oxidoreductase n=1 Tax=Oceanicola sp. S124 TaxID=1042378 RepID=UPI000255860F